MPSHLDTPVDHSSKACDHIGSTLETARFVALWNDHDYRRLGVDEVGPAKIETVWLGSNHGTTERPGLFETTVEEDGVVTERHLHGTIVCAFDGHERVVRDVGRRLRTAAWRAMRRSNGSASA